MARIFGFIGNRPDFGPRLLAAHKEVLSVPRGDYPTLGWGVGFYQSGEVLLRRRPTDDREIVSLKEAVETTRTSLLLGHVRQPVVGEPRTENTQPFRYRMWLFAAGGTIKDRGSLRGRFLDALPPFLRNNVRGDTDSELLFYTFLSFLHDAGSLGDDGAETKQIQSALRGALSLADRLSAEEGERPFSGDVFVADGEHLVVAHRTGPLGICSIQGRGQLESVLSSDISMPSADSTRFTLLVSGLSDLPQGWEAVPDGTCLVARATKPPLMEAL